MAPWTITLGLALLAFGPGPAEPPHKVLMPPDEGMVDLLVECAVATYPGIDPRRDIVYVGVSAQQLTHVRNGDLVGCYPISTARAGLGSINGSWMTPTGLHRISAKIGDGVPPGGIFVERQWTGAIAVADRPADRDAITSRILRLEGLEPGLNSGGVVDSEDRYIYIHGTPDAMNIGRPVSHGCLRMLDSDVIALFDALPTGTPVIILP